MEIVAQDSILFNDSIANNISLSIDNPNMDSIISAAKVAKHIILFQNFRNNITVR